MKILTISTVFPFPPHDGTTIQIFQRIKHLSAINEMTLVSIVDQNPSLHAIEEMRRYCEVHVIRRPAIKVSKGLFTRCLNFLRSVISGVPYYLLDYFHRDVSESIRTQFEPEKFDVIEADLHAGIYLGEEFRGLKVWILHSVTDTSVRRTIRFARGLLQKITLNLYRLLSKRYELRIAGRVDLVVVLTPENEAELRQIDPKINVRNCLTNGVDLDYFDYQPSRNAPAGVCFVGKMDYYPNHDAAVNFYQHVWPLIREKFPLAEFSIIGSCPMPEVRELAKDPTIKVSGYVDDVRPLIRKAGIAVVPIRMGGGILNKVLEAMAMGVPVVASRIAIQGLSVTPGEHLLVCDSDQEFADSVGRLLSDSALRYQLSLAGREYVETYHQWQPIVNKYGDTLKTLVAKKLSGQTWSAES